MCSFIRAEPVAIHLIAALIVRLGFLTGPSPFHRKTENQEKRNSHTGNRTRIGRVRACYPNQLDYMGLVASFQALYINENTNNPSCNRFY